MAHTRRQGTAGTPGSTSSLPTSLIPHLRSPPSSPAHHPPTSGAPAAHPLPYSGGLEAGQFDHYSFPLRPLGPAAFGEYPRDHPRDHVLPPVRTESSEEPDEPGERFPAARPYPADTSRDARFRLGVAAAHAPPYGYDPYPARSRSALDSPYPPGGAGSRARPVSLAEMRADAWGPARRHTSSPQHGAYAVPGREAGGGWEHERGGYAGSSRGTHERGGRTERGGYDADVRAYGGEGREELGSAGESDSEGEGAARDERRTAWHHSWLPHAPSGNPEYTSYSARQNLYDDDELTSLLPHLEGPQHVRHARERSSYPPARNGSRPTRDPREQVLQRRPHTPFQAEGPPPEFSARSSLQARDRRNRRRLSNGEADRFDLSGPALDYHDAEERYYRDQARAGPSNAGRRSPSPPRNASRRTTSFHEHARARDSETPAHSTGHGASPSRSSTKRRRFPQEDLPSLASALRAVDAPRFRERPERLRASEAEYTRLTDEESSSSRKRSHERMARAGSSRAPAHAPVPADARSSPPHASPRPRPIRPVPRRGFVSDPGNEGYGYGDGSERGSEDAPAYSQSAGAGPSSAGGRSGSGPDEGDRERPSKKRKGGPKIDVACAFCRRRKMRCDGWRPTCGNCARAVPPRECTYKPEIKRRGPGKKPKQSKSRPRGTARSQTQPDEPALPGYDHVDARAPDTYPIPAPPYAYADPLPVSSFPGLPRGPYELEALKRRETDSPDMFGPTTRTFGASPGRGLDDEHIDPGLMREYIEDEEEDELADDIDGPGAGPSRLAPKKE